MWGARSGLWALIVAFALLGASARAADVVGQVDTVIVWAYGTEPGAERDGLFVRDEVVRNEVVETVSEGGLHIILADGTDLRLGAESRLILDELVYDPATGAGEATIEFVKGAFRFASGHIAKNKVNLTSPSAQIGIRGTDLQIIVGADGATSVDVFSGASRVTAVNSGQAADIGLGERAEVNAAGTVVRVVPAVPGFIDAALAGARKGSSGDDEAAPPPTDDGGQGGDRSAAKAAPRPKMPTVNPTPMITRPTPRRPSHY